MVTTNREEVDAEAQRNAILDAMRNMAEADPVEGEVKVGDIVHAGDADLDTPMMVSKTQGAGVVYIYDRRTGERSRTNRNMLPTQLTKRDENNNLVFTERDPHITPARGELKCLLHADLRSEHPEYDKWGLATCRKSNLASPQEVKSHMQRRHQREWATIENDRMEREKAEDRQIQRANAEATMAALRAATGSGEKADKKAK